MAGSNLLALIDDIASILDDVATMTKVATKKTVGVLGDDLALNAQQVSGTQADRELPVVFAVAKGSLKNKAILAPAALLISAFLPWLIVPLLIIGGSFLCFEGFEKLAHRFLHGKREAKDKKKLKKALKKPDSDILSIEKEKIKGAIRTDFILSAEIVVISLGAVAAESLGVRIAVLIGISLIITVGVYGLVAIIVKLDDAGLYLVGNSSSSLLGKAQNKVGTFILRAAPILMKSLSIAGTAAMFTVGGSILAHGIPGLEGFLHTIAKSLVAIPNIGHTLESVSLIGLEAVTGIIVGAIVVGTMTVIQGSTGQKARS